MNIKDTVRWALWSGFMMSLKSPSSPVKMLNAIIPEQGYNLTRDLAYGSKQRQKLDIYRPCHDVGDSPADTLIFFYGGSWKTGFKADYKFLAQALTGAGFITVIPDYRVYPQVRFPAFMEDAARAVYWVKQNIALYGGDADRVFIAGHSAGAHIAALLALDAHYLAMFGLKPQDLRGMIGLAGPYDFLPFESPVLKAIFGPKALWWKSQPIHFVDGHNPPMLLIHGTQDDTVGLVNSYRLADRVARYQGVVELAEFPGLGHLSVIAGLAKPLRRDGRVLQRIVDFTRRY